jgi:hypothetical protein
MFMTADSAQSSPADDLPAPRKRRRWQFGLSTLLLVVTACAVASWWYARQEPWEEFQQRFTERIKNLGGHIEWGSAESPTRISFRYWGPSVDPTRKSLTDEQLRKLRPDLGRLGPFTLNLSGTENARGAITDAGLSHLQGLLRLECVCLRYTDVTDAGLEHLTRVKGLQFVDLRDTKVTPAAVQGATATQPGLLLVIEDQSSPPAPVVNATGWTFLGSDLDVTFTEVSTGIARKAQLTIPTSLYLSDPETRVRAISPHDLLLSFHGPVSDSGVFVARLDITKREVKVIWQAFAEPLGVTHTKYNYRHDGHLFVQGDRCVLVSDGAATFVEIRDLATGALLNRWVY